MKESEDEASHASSVLVDSFSVRPRRRIRKRRTASALEFFCEEVDYFVQPVSRRCDARSRISL